MEEVDRIIIESLKHLNCDLDEEITSLKGFQPDSVVAAIATCLETINKQLKLPKKLPTSMSAKIKFASDIAEQIKDMGFKGDMGYQTILYCNEVEVRRVLMFLIERLPKESSPVATIEPLGYVPKIVKQIEEKLKQSLNQMWLPSEVLYYGTREVPGGLIVNNFGQSCPLDSVKLFVPSEDTLDYEKYIPEVTKQCSSRQLLPSVLFQDTQLPSSNWKQIANQITLKKDIFENSTLIEPQNEGEPKIETENANVPEEHSKVDVLLKELGEKKQTFISLQATSNGYEDTLLKVVNQREEEQNILKESVAKVKVKNKTLAVVNNEANKIKLKNLIQKSENRLIELANQWKEVQVPLLEEYKELKSSENLKQQDEQYNKLKSLKDSYKEMVSDYKEKCVLEQNLMERCKQLNNKNNRAAYTKRILEIVGNIKKQNHEIQKVLSDTKLVQKDINNLSGQVDRSFTLSDELIFYDCKQDEAARKAYKLLAALREECNSILQGVSDMGHAERELRNLEEQIEIEKNKETRVKLEKVQRDLAEIKNEIQALM